MIRKNFREEYHGYIGENEYSNRKAYVFKKTSWPLLMSSDRTTSWEVDIYEEALKIKTLDLSGHSKQYAEDAAENWVLGVMNV